MAKLRQLEWDKPHGIVSGLPGAFYEQGGILFNAQGVETPTSETQPIIDEPEPEPGDDSEVRPAIVASDPDEQIEPAAADAAAGDKFESMSTKNLKVMIESFGGVWKDRKSALEYLKGKSDA